MAVINTFRIPYKYGDVIRIKPIADVHMGNSYCDTKAFQKYLDERDEFTYFIGIGDLHDAITIKDMKRYDKHSDSAVGVAILDEQKDEMRKRLQPLADEGRIIGLGDGNHEVVSIKRYGTNLTARLCKDLDVPYLGFSGFIRLRLSEGGHRGRTVMIYYHHGFGGGSRTEGANLTKFARHASAYSADIYLYGHVHELNSKSITRMRAVGDKWVANPRHLVICGTFLRTLSSTVDATYAEIAGFPPTAIGGAAINIKPVNEWVRIWVDS